MKPQIVLVSGASGSGKTTLIDQLRKNTLTPGLRDLLPELCGSWPALELNDLLKGNDPSGLLAGHLAGGRDLLLHYDIVMPFRYRLESYDQDPAWSHIGLNRNVTVIFVKPDAATLVDQYLTRSQRRKSEKSAASQVIRKLVREPLRKAFGGGQNGPSTSTPELYASLDFIDSCHASWLQFALGFLRRSASGKLVVVRPAAQSTTAGFEVTQVLT